MSRTSTYRERLWPSPFVFLALALVVPACIIVFAPIAPTLGIVVAILVYLTCISILIATSPVIEVREGILRAGRARISVDKVGEVTAYDADEARKQRGTRLNASAWLLIRGWIKPVAKVIIADSSDPTPYWLLSTRHPRTLAERITQEQNAHDRDHWP